VEMNCVDEIAGIVAMGGGVESPFYGQGEEANAARRKWTNAYGDHLTSLAVLDAYTEAVQQSSAKQFVRENFVRGEVLHQAMQARQQLVDICKDFSSASSGSVGPTTLDSMTVKKCLACGMSTHVARRVGKSEYEPVFRGTKGTSGNKGTAFLHPSSTLSMIGVRPEYIVYDEILVTSKTYLRGVSAVEDPAWLTQDQPELFRQVPAGGSGDDNKAVAEKKQQERNEKKQSRAVLID